jgi:hypothetical protein
MSESPVVRSIKAAEDRRIEVIIRADGPQVQASVVEACWFVRSAELVSEDTWILDAPRCRGRICIELLFWVATGARPALFPRLRKAAYLQVDELSGGQLLFRAPSPERANSLDAELRSLDSGVVTALPPHHVLWTVDPTGLDRVLALESWITDNGGELGRGLTVGVGPDLSLLIAAINVSIDGARPHADVLGVRAARGGIDVALSDWFAGDDESVNKLISFLRGLSGVRHVDREDRELLQLRGDAATAFVRSAISEAGWVVRPPNG